MADNTKVKLTSGENVIEVSIERAEDLITMNLRGGSGWTLADDGYEMVDGRLTRKRQERRNQRCYEFA